MKGIAYSSQGPHSFTRLLSISPKVVLESIGGAVSKISQQRVPCVVSFRSALQNQHFSGDVWIRLEFSKTQDVDGL
jgi:hypothetical protein